jgi:hypothetical protein
MVKVGDEDFATAGGTLVLTVRYPRNGSTGVGVVLSDDMGVGVGLAGRIPHYSKYSYLGFAGTSPVLKGTWEEDESPLYMELTGR